MKIKVATGVAIYHAGRVLLIRKRRGPYKLSKWCVPGGKLDVNETLEACAKREVLEETNIRVKNLKKAPFGEDVTMSKGRMTHFVFANFTADYSGGNSRPIDDAIEVKWLERKQLTELELSKPTRELFLELSLLPKPFIYGAKR